MSRPIPTSLLACGYLFAACQLPLVPHAISIDARDLPESGSGAFEILSLHRRPLDVLVYRSRAFDPERGPIWFVMHGASRNAERYLAAAAPVAERHAALAVVIRFPREVYPTSEDYTLGAAGSALAPHLEVERVFDALRAALGGRQTGYYLFGHSAGAQFTHRLVTFVHDARVLGAVAANAGWYTLPSFDRGPETHMPYGLADSPLTPEQLGRVLSTPLTVLLGERDIEPAGSSRMLRDTPEAMAQGETRMERGRRYHEAGRLEAARRGLTFDWRLQIVPRAGHDAARMIDSAGFLTFDPDTEPCRSSSADEGQELVFTEILADPPKGLAGDANGDGKRDPSEDEFVEILNAGTHAVCLVGWALGDADEPERHVFRLGRALPPGGRVVVFGGGIPTGEFDGAEVQWAGAGLNLSNGGETIALRDREDRVARSLSWGDCDGMPPAADHYPEDLELSGSIRRPAAGTPWISSATDLPRFTPGAIP